MRNNLAQKAIAEGVGAFAFTFVGVGAIVTDELTRGSVGLLGIALAHGLALAVMLSAVAHISGGHINPAVSLAFAVTGRISSGTAVVYILAQLAGAVAAGLLLTVIFPADLWQAARLGATVLHPDVAPGQGILIEAVLTFFLVLAVFGTTVDDRGPNQLAGYCIGTVFIFGILLGGPLTGASMNPARTFGSALVGGVWDHHFVYWIGPIVGGVAAAVLYDKFLRRPGRSKEMTAWFK